MARYILEFRYGDTGLQAQMSFIMFRRVSDLVDIPNNQWPTIYEFGSGLYYFDYVATTDIAYAVDGGNSIPTPEIRYIRGRASPRDNYLDQAVSQVRDSILGDTSAWPTGSKGAQIDRLDDIQAKTDNLPSDPASQSQVETAITSARDNVNANVDTTRTTVVSARDSIKGTDNRSLTDVAGAGFTSASSLTSISSTVSTVPATSTAVTAIKAKTDNLPADPASQTQVATAITNARDNINSNVGSVETAVTAARDSIQGVDGMDLSSMANSLDALSTKVDPISLIASTVAAILAKTDGLPTDTDSVLQELSDRVERTLGMLHENSVMDQTSFDSNNNLTNARLRLYTSKSQTLDPDSFTPIATYSIIASYTGPNLQSYAVVRES